MKKITPLIHFILSSFLTYQSFQLFSKSFSNQENLPIAIEVLMAFLCNLFVTGSFAFVGFSFPTSRLLPKEYYHISNSKLIEKIYQLLGVSYFRYFLLSTVWKSKKKQKTFFNGTKSGLEQFLFSSNQAEFGHLGALIFIQVYATIMFFKSEYGLFIICSIINLFFNLYPIVLQRFHRIRIQKILNNNPK
jgi:hypothetical protein